METQSLTRKPFLSGEHEIVHVTRTAVEPRGSVSQAVLVGLIAVVICCCWLALKIHFLHRDNWSSIFYTGEDGRIPREVWAREKVYLFPGVGYDGQYYHLIAHDPLMKLHYRDYFDMPRLRYRRILVPGLAALMSFGNSVALHASYVSIILASIFLGTFWAARLAVSCGYSAVWGLLFLAMPTTLVTMLFMIVDGTLGALTVGFLWYAKCRDNMRLFIVLTCAALTREFGLFLIAAYCLWLLFQKDVKRALLFGTAVVPTALWYWFVQLHTPPRSPEWFSAIPFLGVYRGIVGHWTYRQPLLRELDFVGIAGMLLAFGIAGYYLFKNRLWSPVGFMAAIFLLFAIFLSNGDIWPEVNAFGRYYQPVLLFVILSGVATRAWWTFAPLVMVDLRIVAVFAKHALAIAQSMFRPG